MQAKLRVRVVDQITQKFGVAEVGVDGGDVLIRMGGSREQGKVKGLGLKIPTF